MFVKDSFHISTREEKNSDLFCIAYSLYVLLYVLPITSHIIIIIAQILQIGSLALIIVTSVNFFQFKFDSSYLQIFFFLYFTWQIVTVLRGYAHFHTDYWKNFFLNPNNGILYFSPLLIFFPRNLYFYQKLFKVIIVLGIFYILFDLVFVKSLLNSDDTNKNSKALVETLSALAFPCGFVLLTLFYHTKKRQILASAVLLSGVFFAIVRARRGLILMYSEILLVAFIIYVLKARGKVFMIYLTILVTLIGALYVSYVYKPLNNHIYSFLLSRGEEDTRTPVELYFYNDMKLQGLGNRKRN